MREKIVLLRGGIGSGFSDSIRSGGFVIEHLPKEKYDVVDILIDKNGTWHRMGLPITPDVAILDADVVFNCLHGHFGEDGKIQQILHKFGVPFTGSHILASALGMNKTHTRKILSNYNIQSPFQKILNSNILPSEAGEIFRAFPFPAVLKPISGHGGENIHKVKTPEDLVISASKLASNFPEIILEEDIDGKSVSCFVVEKLRGRDLYTFMPIHDESNKSGRDAFLQSEVENLEKISKDVFNVLNLRHIAQVDLILSPSRGVYVIEVNTQPIYHENSKILTALKSVGLKPSDFFEHMIKIAKS
jgi:D-alanine--D-alanine ligase